MSAIYWHCNVFIARFYGSLLHRSQFFRCERENYSQKIDFCRCQNPETKQKKAKILTRIYQRMFNNFLFFAQTRTPDWKLYVVEEKYTKLMKIRFSQIFFPFLTVIFSVFSFFLLFYYFIFAWTLKWKHTHYQIAKKSKKYFIFRIKKEKSFD